MATLLAALAGSTSGIGKGAAVLRPGPASDVFTVALTLLAVGAAACLAVLVRALALPSRGHRERDGRRRGSLRERLIAITVFVATATIFAVLLHHRPRAYHRVFAVAGAGGPRHTAASAVRFSSPAATLTVVTVLALAALTLGVPAWRRRRWVRARSALHPLVAPEAPEAPADAGSARTDRRSIAEAMAGLTVAEPEQEPDPRRAIVAAYLALSAAAARSGLRRRSDETASEYLDRLLSSAGAPQGPARRLTATFETARYSSMPIGEETRWLAIDDLRHIRAAMGAPS